MEDIKDIIGKVEVKMVKNHDRVAVLRLMCLLGVTQSGLKKDEFDYIRKAYIACYGFNEIPLMMNLQDAGILRPRDDKLNWKKCKETFRLLNENVNMATPTDISYVFNGLAPLSVRIIEYLMSEKGLKNIQKYMKVLNCPQAPPPENEHELFMPLRRSASNERRKILVYFIGGITFAEISAIRFLNNLYADKQFIIATTSIISAKKCLNQLSCTIESNLDKNSVLRQ
jgi:hypothetical protein